MNLYDICISAKMKKLKEKKENYTLAHKQCAGS